MLQSEVISTSGLESRSASNSMPKLHHAIAWIPLCAFLAACSMPDGATLPPKDTSLAQELAQKSSHRISWMGRGLRSRDLLYVSNENGTVNIYRYWQHTIVGVLTNFVQPEGICSDRAGNVYIVDRHNKTISEYAHAGQKLIKILDDPQAPWACSVDPASGDLAVANWRKESVAIYKDAMGTPQLYRPNDTEHFIGCAYDDRGDLLIASAPGYYEYYSGFYYLPKGGTELIPMTLPGGNYYSGERWVDVEGVAWDGKYWVVDAYRVLYRFKINVNAKYVDSTALSGTYSYVGPIAIYRKTAAGQATQVVGTTYDFESHSSVDFWKYPAGGSAYYSITQDLNSAQGVA